MRYLHRLGARFYLLQRQKVIQQLQKNPKIAPGAIQDRRLLNWTTIILLVAASSSTTMAAYLGVEVYRVHKSTENKTRSVFLPLWLSFNWPYQRRYNFPAYLDYVDSDFASHIAASDFALNLFDRDVQYQVLDTLLRLKTARDLFGVPFSVRANNDSFSIWIEPKWPLVHGPQVEIKKQNGTLKLRWKWDIKPIRCSSVDSFLTALGIKLDRIDPVIKPGTSGAVHEAGHIERSTTQTDYTIAFEGKFSMMNRQTVKCGVVEYGGVIDFSHLGISNGVKILRVDLTVNSDDTPITYKLR